MCLIWIIHYGINEVQIKLCEDCEKYSKYQVCFYPTFVYSGVIANLPLSVGSIPTLNALKHNLISFHSNSDTNSVMPSPESESAVFPTLAAYPRRRPYQRIPTPSLKTV